MPPTQSAPAKPFTDYIGRFAPSPSGPLHFGSLVCALASYLDARANRGQWLVRIEDIDPPREQPGARKAILECLAAHELRWDAEPVYQSERQEVFRALLDRLTQERLVYPCACTRQRLQHLGGVYDGHCRRQPTPVDKPAALRLKVSELPAPFDNTDTRVHFNDLIQGLQQEDVSEGGDFVVHRKDGLFAYQLAVVADDIAQGITRVVRGSDLLDTTGRQIYLFRLLGAKPPEYGHIPVVVNTEGRKLSKQNHAPAIDNQAAAGNLWHACHCLGLSPPGRPGQVDTKSLLAWAIDHWRLERVPRRMAVPEPAGPSR